jgi:hypothetical protein
MTSQIGKGYGEDGARKAAVEEPAPSIYLRGLRAFGVVFVGLAAAARVTAPGIRKSSGFFPKTRSPLSFGARRTRPRLTNERGASGAES